MRLSHISSLVIETLLARRLTRRTISIYHNRVIRCTTMVGIPTIDVKLSQFQIESAAFGARGTWHCLLDTCRQPHVLHLFWRPCRVKAHMKSAPPFSFEVSCCRVANVEARERDKLILNLTNETLCVNRRVALCDGGARHKWAVKTNPGGNSDNR
jgi:hypothetical protein